MIYKSCSQEQANEILTELEGSCMKSNFFSCETKEERDEVYAETVRICQEKKDFLEYVNKELSPIIKKNNYDIPIDFLVRIMDCFSQKQDLSKEEILRQIDFFLRNDCISENTSILLQAVHPLNFTDHHCLTKDEIQEAAISLGKFFDIKIPEYYLHFIDGKIYNSIEESFYSDDYLLKKIFCQCIYYGEIYPVAPNTNPILFWDYFHALFSGPIAYNITEYKTYLSEKRDLFFELEKRERAC